MTLFSFLAAAVGPLAIRILLALGISVATFTGVTSILSQLVGQAQSNWSSMPAALVGLIGVAGGHTAVGMILGAVNARAALWVASSATRWVVKGS